MKSNINIKTDGAIPVAVGFLSPPVLRPGGVVIGASSRGVREVWIYMKPLARDRVRRIFTRRLREGGSIPAADPGASAILDGALRELAAYFRGDLRKFSSPLDFQGRGSPFQNRVWNALRSIPYGKTRSYGGIARAIGRPRASRAVGGSCGRNPIPVLVPCHRVVGSDGSLTGFSAGLPLKSILLSLENG